MYVLGHDNGRVEVKSAVIPAQAALQNEIASSAGQGDLGALSKTDEDGTICFLVVRKAAAILVFVAEHD
jgi:hypothetical protein